MKTLYFIRHAESEANKKKNTCQSSAVSADSGGKADSVKIASELKALAEIDAILSSPLKRAMETAESFSDAFGLPIQAEERLIEQELGMFSGMSYDEVKTRADYQHDALNRWDWKPEGGESYSMIAERICSFLSDIERDTGPGRLLIVTHAVALRMIIAALEDSLPVYPKEFPNNGEILKVEFRN